MRKSVHLVGLCHVNKLLLFRIIE